MNESGDMETKVPVPLEHNPINNEPSSVHYDTSAGKLVQPENKQQTKQEIRKLAQEIEAIQFADAKVEDGKLRGIPKEAIADDISVAGLSVEERQEKIRTLQQQLHQESPSKHWWQKAVVVGGMFLAGLFATKEAGGQSVAESKAKADTEAIAKTTIESPKEDFLNYVQYLKEKNDSTIITPEDMDTYLQKFGNADGLQEKDLAENFLILRDIYAKHSPYSLDGKKVAMKGVMPGYDLEYGYDKEDKILLNKVLTSFDFDFSQMKQLGTKDLGYGEVVSDFIFRDTITVNDRIIKVHFSNNGLDQMFEVYITDTKQKPIAHFICPTTTVARSFGKDDNSKFTEELNRILGPKN